MKTKDPSFAQTVPLTTNDFLSTILNSFDDILSISEGAPFHIHYLVVEEASVNSWTNIGRLVVPLNFAILKGFTRKVNSGQV